MVENILIWCCVIVFVSTCVITLLGITNLIKIDKLYLNKLFYSLIVEVIAIGVFTFSQYTKEDKIVYVRTTYPLVDTYIGSNNFLYVGGIALMNENQILAIQYILNKDTTLLTFRKTDSKDMFLLNIPLHKYYNDSIIDVQMISYIIEDNEIIKTDDYINITLTK